VNFGRDDEDEIPGKHSSGRDSLYETSLAPTTADECCFRRERLLVRHNDPTAVRLLYGIVLIIVGLVIDPGASVWRPLTCSVVEGRNDVPSNEGQDGKHDDYDRGVLDRRVSGETG
jgi:hypothetical protein